MKALVITLVMLAAGAAQAFDRSTDSLALVALYDNTNGPGWGNHTNWKTTATIDTWYGVTVTNDRVTQLCLPNNNLTGTLPTPFGNLNNLFYLYLGGNHLTGSIPSSIGNLSQLAYLYLNNNQLSGPIPDAIGNLHNLQYLHLYINNLSGAIPASIGNLTGLTQFLAYYNALTSLPSEIGNMTSLQYLWLSNNQLSGSIPSAIGNLNNLLNLQLSGNQLTGSIPSSIGNLSQLAYLYLNNNQLSGPIPDAIGNLHNLQYLHLYINNLSGAIPASIGNLTGLTQFLAYYNALTSLPSEIGNMTSLQYLWLSNNQLSGSIPSTIGNLNNLLNLQLSGNQLTGSIPSSIGNLSQLAYLYLNNNQLSGPIPDAIGNLHNLQYLHLYINKLSGAIPASIGNLTGLTQFLVYYNALTSLPSEIGNLTNLQYLHVSFNNIKNVPSTITNLTALIGLSIIYNRICNPLPSNVDAWLTGKDPSWKPLQTCTGSRQSDSLALISLYNSTSGATWTPLTWNTANTIDTWPGVTVAYDRVVAIQLPINNLVGTIPADLQNLSELTILDLNNNSLSNTVPSELGSLFPSLTYLDLSANELSGMGGGVTQLVNLTGAYFENNRLCNGITDSVEMWLGQFDPDWMVGQTCMAPPDPGEDEPGIVRADMYLENHVIEDMITTAPNEYCTFGDGRIEYSKNSNGALVENTRFYIKDHLGSTRLVVNSAGTPLEVVGYDAYGATIRSEIIAGNESPVKEKFTGKEFDQNGPQFCEIDLDMSIVNFQSISSPSDVASLAITFSDGTTEYIPFVTGNNQVTLNSCLKYPIDKTIIALQVQTMVVPGMNFFVPAINYGAGGTTCPLNFSVTCGNRTSISFNVDAQLTTGLNRGMDCTNDYFHHTHSVLLNPNIAGMQLDYFGARYYDPEIGVFLGTDPKDVFWNPYSYCGGNPVIFFDPDGQGPFTFLEVMKDIEMITEYTNTLENYLSRLTSYIGGTGSVLTLSEAEQYSGSLLNAIQHAQQVHFCNYINSLTFNTASYSANIMNSADAVLTSNGLRTALDVAGAVPVIGAPADVTSALISFKMGEYATAGVSLATAFPIVGDIAFAGKWAAKGLVNVTSKARTVDQTLSLGERWVGKGYKEIGKKGSGVFRSADETKQFRMTNSDITGAHGKIGPHTNFERIDPATGEVIKNIHVPLLDR